MPAKRNANRKGMKLKTLSLQSKVKLIEALDNGAHWKEVAQRFKVGKTTLYDIKRQKNKIYETLANRGKRLKKNYVSSPKRMKSTKYPLIDKMVYKWYIGQRNVGQPISGKNIMFAAQELAKNLDGYENFQASQGWLNKFRNRHNLAFRTVSGEAASADVEALDRFRQDFLGLIVEQNLLWSQVYNADETGVFWKAAPKRTMAHRYDRDVRGRKMCKNHFSTMVGTSGDGSHHLKAMVVGHFKKPCCYKNKMNRLPVIYRSRQNV